MSQHTINGVEYDVHPNSACIQPKIMINGSVMCVGIWNGESKESADELLALAVAHYEYHKANGTLKVSNYYLHPDIDAQQVKQAKPIGKITRMIDYFKKRMTRTHE